MNPLIIRKIEKGFFSFTNNWVVLCSFSFWSFLFLIYLGLINISGQTSLPFVNADFNKTSAWLEATAKERFAFSAASFALALSTVWSGVVAIKIFAKHRSIFDGKMPIKWRIVFSAEVAILLALGLLSYFHILPPPGGYQLDSYVTEIVQMPWPSPSICKLLQKLLAITNGAVLIGVMLIFNAVLALTMSVNVSLRGKKKIRNVSRCINHYRAMLYSSSALLIFGVLATISLFQWAIDSHHELHLTEPFNVSKIDGLDFAVGVGFSSLLVMLFLPTGIILEQKLSRVLAESVGGLKSDFDLQKWRIRNEITSSPLTTFAGYLALLSPLIASILTKILGSP